MSCPCGSDAALETCCRPFIRGEARPETAEKLMRSRYTAYALGEVDYIIDTHDPAMRDDLDPEATRDWAERAEWEGLDVLDVKDGGEGDEAGEVEFVARYTVGERTRAHHERAIFHKREGRWYFHDGKVVGGEPIRRESPKVGRNDPCPCGSGKKHKKCCGRPSATQ